MLRHKILHDDQVICEGELEPVRIPTTQVVGKTSHAWPGIDVKREDGTVEREVDLRPGDVFCPTCGFTAHQWTGLESSLNELTNRFNEIHALAGGRAITTAERQELEALRDAIADLQVGVVLEARGDLEATIE